MLVSVLRKSYLLLLLIFAAASCGKAGTAIAPSPLDGARVMLVGQSNADGLGAFLQEKIRIIPFIDYNATVEAWLGTPSLATAAAHPDLVGFVWWQGASDIETPPALYAERLRALIAVVRSTHRSLPVRIIEIPTSNGRAPINEAQRLVSGDNGVQLIPTADLLLLPTGHFAPDSYLQVRERLLRSLGR